jgi:hypothetical protein
LLTGGPASLLSRAIAAAAAESGQLLPYALQACLPALLVACVERVSAQIHAAAEGSGAAAVQASGPAGSAPQLLAGQSNGSPVLEQQQQQQQAQELQSHEGPQQRSMDNGTQDISSMTASNPSTSAASTAAAAVPAAYCSPLQRNIVAIKLDEPPGTSELPWCCMLACRTMSSCFASMQSLPFAQQAQRKLQLWLVLRIFTTLTPT